LHAYCHLLEALRSSFSDYPRRVADLREAVAHVGARAGRNGSINFLLGDGQQLYARCATKLCYIIRKAPFGFARLADDDVVIDFSEVTTPKDRVAIVSTVPLTNNEAWCHGVPGTLWVFDRGRLQATLQSR
jgi:predicted glutamine amidotransferase